MTEQSNPTHSPAQAKSSVKRPGHDREFRAADASLFCKEADDRYLRRYWAKAANCDLRLSGNVEDAIEHACYCIRITKALMKYEGGFDGPACADVINGELVLLPPPETPLSERFQPDDLRKSRQAPRPGFVRRPREYDPASLKAREQWCAEKERHKQEQLALLQNKPWSVPARAGEAPVYTIKRAPKPETAKPRKDDVAVTSFARSSNLSEDWRTQVKLASLKL